MLDIILFDTQDIAPHFVLKRDGSGILFIAQVLSSGLLSQKDLADSPAAVSEVNQSTFTNKNQ